MHTPRRLGSRLVAVRFRLGTAPSRSASSPLDRNRSPSGDQADRVAGEEDLRASDQMKMFVAEASRQTAAWATRRPQRTLAHDSVVRALGGSLIQAHWDRSVVLAPADSSPRTHSSESVAISAADCRLTAPPVPAVEPRAATASRRVRKTRSSTHPAGDGRDSDRGGSRLSRSQIGPLERARQVASSRIDLSPRTSARFSRRTINP